MARDKSDILAGKTALITGAGGGIGSRIAVRLSMAGAKVALHYHRAKPLEAVKNIISEGGTEADTCLVQADFNAANFAAGLLDKVEMTLGTADILVNCAASQDVASLETMTDIEFDRMMKTNVSAIFSLSNQFAKRLSGQPVSDPSIINISSIEACRPAAGHAHYATSKAAVEMLTKSMALEFGPTGLRVNAIAPGLIAREEIAADWPQGVQSWESRCPLGRMGTADDIAEAVLFLASSASSFITGTTITIDGGMSVTPGW